MAKKSLKELRDKIAARRAERAAGKTKKYAKMRLVAAKAPEKLEKHLTMLADKYASAAEGIENLRENLGLVRPAKNAPLKVRVGATRDYAAKFRRIAEEAPEKLEDALAEAYQGLNDIAQDIEMAAEQMGVELDAAPEEGGSFPPAVEEEVAGDIVEEAKEEGEAPEFELLEKAEDSEPEEEKEAAGGDAWSTDRDESGNPKAPIEADVPRTAAGSEPWVSDRDESGSPKSPDKAEIPAVQVKAAKATPAGKKSAIGNL